MFRVAPYNQVEVRRSEFDNLLNIMDRAFAEEPKKEFVRGFKVDIKDLKETYVFEADLPGVNKEEITVDYIDNKLVIKVEVKEEEDKEDVKYIRRERHISSMKRVFAVKDIQKEAINAKFENGVLTVITPKVAEEERTIKIDIQ